MPMTETPWLLPGGAVLIGVCMGVCSWLALRLRDARRLLAASRSTEASARQRYALLEAMFMAAPDGILLADDQGRILQVNPRLVEMTGFTAEALLGQSLEMLLPERFRGMHRQQVAGYMAAPRTRGMASGKDLHARRADGSEFPAAVSLSPVVLDGRSCVIASLRDVTERVLIKEALRTALQAAEDGSRAESAFVANMSHEIRTPLNGILGMVELILSTDLDPIQRQYLDILKTSAESLRGVVNDVLDFSRIKAGQMHIEALPFELSKTLCQVAKSMAPAAREKGLEICCEIAPEVPSVVIGDSARLRQILWNLLGNALKFTASGGVFIQVSADSQGAGGNGLALHFSVRDTGIGIPAERHERIFEKYMQAEAHTTREYGGTGLGLAICRHLVSMMDGDLWLESAQGQGSTFHFTARFGSCPELQPPDYQHVFEGRMIVVVDGQANHRRILTDLLRRKGAVLQSFASAAEALVWIESAEGRLPCDLLLLDARMSGMNGFELAGLLATRERWRQIPVVMMSSGELRPRDAQRESAGIVAHLVKPVCRDEMISVAAGILAAGAVSGASGRPRPSLEGRHAS